MAISLDLREGPSVICAEMAPTHNQLKAQTGFSGDTSDKVPHEAVFGSAAGEDGYASLIWGINHRWPHQAHNCDELCGPVIGAGPSGLSTAIKLKQLDPEITICILEKGSEVGAHILSGNVFETKALDELLPNWKSEGAPVKTKVSKEKFLFLGKNSSLSWPTWLLPAVQKNHKNYIVSLANLCRWLAEQAEKLGVEIFPGFPASEVLYNEDGSITEISSNGNGTEPEELHPLGDDEHFEIPAFIRKPKK